MTRLMKFAGGVSVLAIAYAAHATQPGFQVDISGTVHGFCTLKPPQSVISGNASVTPGTNSEDFDYSPLHFPNYFASADGKGLKAYPVESG